MISLSRLKEMVEEEMENKIKDLELALKRKEQECEKLSFDNFDLKDQLTDLKFKYKTINDVAKSFEQKLQTERKECEELKKDVIEALKLVEITSTHNTFQETKINRLSKTLTEIKDFFKEECLICKENYINITGEICKECKYQDILRKINEVE